MTAWQSVIDDFRERKTERETFENGRVQQFWFIHKRPIAIRELLVILTRHTCPTDTFWPAGRCRMRTQVANLLFSPLFMRAPPLIDVVKSDAVEI